MLSSKDISILRSLGEQYAALSALQVQQEKIALWKKLNSLRPSRPMVAIDQLPWHQLNDDGSLTLLCEDTYARSIEENLRRSLYAWRNFPADMVLEPFIRISKAVSGFNYGEYRVEEETIAADTKDGIRAHKYEDCLRTDEDIEDIRLPHVVPHPETDRDRIEQYAAVFDGIIPVRLSGYGVHCGVWDRLSTIRGVTPLLYDMIDNPEFVLKSVRRLTLATSVLTDQLEKLSLLDPSLPYIHCTGAFTDELPMDKPETSTASETWGMGLAQILAAVSPAMYDEFEIQPLKQLLERFGLMYYGCCDPLHNKIDVISQVKNIRKVSVSPWADEELSAKQMAGRYVFSRKPNPAMLTGVFDETQIRAHLEKSLRICREYGVACELILKDVSTVDYEPERLRRWNLIALELAEKYSV